MPPYHILSLDGGGIRGVLSASLLERLDAQLPGLLDKVDLLAGTSTGGILALGFAFGFTPKKARELYEVLGQGVFTRSPQRQAGQFLVSKYSNHGLKQILEDNFGNKTLGDLSKKVLITSFDLDIGPEYPPPLRTWKPKFFHNYPGRQSDADQLIVDVALRTAAAPTYFPIYQGYVDGGVVANNPSMCALAQAINLDTGGQKLEDVSLFSLGTGRNPRFLTVQDADWGLLPWVTPLRDVVLEGNAGVADYQCRNVLGNRYHRLDPPLPEQINLDDVTKVPRLKEIAEQMPLTATLAWLKPSPDPQFRGVTFRGWF